MMEAGAVFWPAIVEVPRLTTSRIKYCCIGRGPSDANGGGVGGWGVCVGGGGVKGHAECQQ